MGYGDYHSHTPGDVGAAPEGHHHSAYDVGAAEDGHRHYPHEVGASPEGHEHQLHQIAGAASKQDLKELESQGRQQWQRLTSAEDAIRALQDRCSVLMADLEAERTLNSAMREGAVTLPLLVHALRYEAQIAQNYDYGQALFALASTVERVKREAR